MTSREGRDAVNEELRDEDCPSHRADRIEAKP